MNRIIYVILAVGLGMGIWTSSGYSDRHWPEEVQAHVDQAVSWMEERWALPARKQQRIEGLGERFDAELQALASLVSPELRAQAREQEGRDIGAKLILLAEYKAEHADRIDAVIEAFVTRPGSEFPTRVAPKPPKITADWADEEHRLAWEYLLLKPGVLDRFVEQRAGTALADINDPASAVTVATSIRTSLAKGSIPGRFRDQHQRTMLDALGGLPSAVSLEALMAYPEWLEASRAIDAVKGELPETRTSDLDMSGYPTRVLRESMRTRPQSGWQELLRNPPPALTPRQLERVRELQRPGGDIKG